jgi:hypothetical protein
MLQSRNTQESGLEFTAFLAAKVYNIIKATLLSETFFSLCLINQFNHCLLEGEGKMELCKKLNVIVLYRHRPLAFIGRSLPNKIGRIITRKFCFLCRRRRELNVTLRAYNASKAEESGAVFATLRFCTL